MSGANLDDVFLVDLRTDFIYFEGSILLIMFQ